MGQKFTLYVSWILSIAAAISMNIALAVPIKTDSTGTFHLKNRAAIRASALRSGLKTSFLQVKVTTPAPAKAVEKVTEDKMLSNVQVYPNPIIDQINLKYTVSRNTNVTIKILDVLGNNVATLFSQRVEPGEQKFTYYINNKLTSGFYFVRIVVGTESVIKRISVL